MLGIVIGVGAVIAMLGVGKGAKDAIRSQIAALGTNVVMVMPGAFTSSGARVEAGTTSRLTLEDIRAIQSSCPAVAHVSPIARSGAQLKYSNQNWRTSVYGAYPGYFDIRDWRVAEGSAFTDVEERASAKVCVIGATVALNLCGEQSAVGAVIRIRNLPFKVIGVLAEKGQNATGQDQDDIVIAPFSTVQKKLTGSIFVNSIITSAISSTSIDDARSQINEAMVAQRKGVGGDGVDYTIRTQTELASTAESTAKTMSMLLASIAAVSLLVGGIGIMNIMLVSVAERTREIGIRMAVGAQGFDILTQFLIESIVLSVLGGIAGIVFGVSTALGIGILQHWPVAVSISSIALGFGFSFVIGVFFGWYPARRASRLNPIVALRYE